MRGGEPQEIYREKKRVILDSSMAERCYGRTPKRKRENNRIFLDSSMVEHAAVNRGVVGSSPTRGVKKTL